MERHAVDKLTDLDVVVVGGGLAGLAAAWHLRGRRLAVLEAGECPGGRVASDEGSAILNLGAHMVPGEGSLVGALTAELGLVTRPLPPRLIGMQYAGRRHLGLSPSFLPLLLDLSLKDRIAFARVGLWLSWGAQQSVRVGRRRSGEQAEIAHFRQLGFEDDRTLADYLGPMPPTVARLVQALTERNGADPEQMSAGHGLRSFANVWARTAPGTSIVGGTGRLPVTLAGALGPAVRTGHRVTNIRLQSTYDGPRVHIRLKTRSGPETIAARACILATPAAVTRTIAPDLPDHLLEALCRIRYGPFLSVAVALDRIEAPPWVGTYAISTPGLSFSVLFNHSVMQPEPDGRGALMLFRGASGAGREMQGSDDQIVDRWLADLVRAFPETRGRIREVRVGRWPEGAPFAFPGRARLQADLERDAAPFWLAGDYLEFPNMEAAARSGAAAAQRAGAWLDRGGR